jgi:soluble lytic murein transglycosylase-like protein
MRRRIARMMLASGAAATMTITLAVQPAYASAQQYQGQRAVWSTPAPAYVSRALAKRILIQAARNHNLNPNFVLAVSYWESGWNQSAISYTGAVGLMQVEPYTAVWAGPKLLHRRVNLYNPYDNAEMGAALLRYYLDVLGDPRLTLAAYYQGLNGVRRYGIYPSSRGYVEGIWRLRNRFQTYGVYP